MRSVFLFIGIGIGEEGEIVAQLNLEPAEPIFVRHAIIMIVRMLIDIKAVVFACFGQCDVRGDVEVVRLHIGEHHVAIFGGGKSENWHMEILSRSVGDRKSTRMNSSHYCASRKTSSACKKKTNNTNHEITTCTQHSDTTNS